jgi:sulfur transfer protein SufE
MNEPLREVTNIESRVESVLQKGRKLPTLPKIEEVVLVGLT